MRVLGTAEQTRVPLRCFFRHGVCLT
jgi:hypothetical protein